MKNHPKIESMFFVIVEHFFFWLRYVRIYTDYPIFFLQCTDGHAMSDHDILETHILVNIIKLTGEISSYSFAIRNETYIWQVHSRKEDAQIVYKNCGWLTSILDK